MFPACPLSFYPLTAIPHFRTLAPQGLKQIQRKASMFIVAANPEREQATEKVPWFSFIKAFSLYKS